MKLALAFNLLTLPDFMGVDAFSGDGGEIPPFG